MDSRPSQSQQPHHHNNFLHFLHTTTSSLLSHPPQPSQTFSLFNSNSNSNSNGAASSHSQQQARPESKRAGGGGLFPQPQAIRVRGVDGRGGKGGPAFVGQVFTMCDLSGTGLMAVSTHFDIPFISKRTPEWLKRMFATLTKSERNGPIFRFFMDLGDAVSYVKRLNIPSGIVGACRLDLAYEHYKEKPELYQFVPNEKQVKAANKLLKKLPHAGGSKGIDGVPIFSAQNLDIAIATTDGIKWYTPFFFDKNMLDKILEESVDQHFQDLIQSRRMNRQREVVDDNLASEVIEELGDSLWEPPEIQEMMGEVGQPGIPLSVITKAAEMQLLYSVDKVLLGNKWLRKATGIQPKYPYIVDSFERRSSAALLRASKSVSCLANSEEPCTSSCQETDLRIYENSHVKQGRIRDLRFPFADWFDQLLPKQRQSSRREGASREYINENVQPNPLLPKITMIGFSTSEPGPVTKASLKKTMRELTKELEQTDGENNASRNKEPNIYDRDPLFVANVGDYYSGMKKKAYA